MQCAIEKIGKRDIIIQAKDKLIKHMKQAAEDFVKKSKNMSIEESIQKLINDIVANSAYKENKPISHDDAKIFVKSVANNLENWVKVHTGHPSAVRYDPVSFSAAFNLYLRSSAAANQMKEDHCFIMPTASHCTSSSIQQESICHQQ